MASSPASQIAASAALLGKERSAGRPLPSLLFLTDPVRTPDPVAVAENLPGGSGVILRHYGAPGREALARTLAKTCKRRGLLFLVGADHELARDVGADGVHFPEALVERTRAIRLRQPDWLITAAAHGIAGLRQAEKSQVDAALLAPVFATDSHPGQSFLGPLRFRALVRSTAVPVYGLGGISVRTIRRLEGAKAVGVAVIGAAMGRASDSVSPKLEA